MIDCSTNCNCSKSGFELKLTAFSSTMAIFCLWKPIATILNVINKTIALYYLLPSLSLQKFNQLFFHCSVSRHICFWQWHKSFKSCFELHVKSSVCLWMVQIHCSCPVIWLDSVVEVIPVIKATPKSSKLVTEN